jgi:hypothetical protein
LNKLKHFSSLPHSQNRLAPPRYDSSPGVMAGGANWPIYRGLGAASGDLDELAGVVLKQKKSVICPAG